MESKLNNISDNINSLKTTIDSLNTRMSLLEKSMLNSFTNNQVGSSLLLSQQQMPMNNYGMNNYMSNDVNNDELLDNQNMPKKGIIIPSYTRSQNEHLRKRYSKIIY